MGWKNIFNCTDIEFDKILVDAPCSGEGTLRSSPRTYIMWNIKTIKNKQTTQVELPKFVKSNIKEISSFFGQKVEVKISGKEKGNIIIPFHSEEDFIRIKKLLE